MQITAAMVKELRERTGSGMMECKKALQEVDGDMETAIANMRKSGLAKADKKAGRVAAEGLVVIAVSDDKKEAAIVEINCETDFVSGGDEFKAFTTGVAQCILANSPADVEALSAMTLEGGKTIEETRQGMVAKIGENIQVRRFERKSTEGAFGSYNHGIRMGVMVELNKDDQDLIKDIAMHIAAINPTCIGEDDVPEEMLAKEKAILVAQAKESGKPDEIIEKMIGGRIRKYLAEITLMGQAFVKDPDQTVEQLVKSKDATINSFVRFEVGEGIEKKVENFADEVMAQIGAS
ncbi:MAG: elongation factor Ts [endosymbiont of Galathealinum brachiosum]|uniref:Elongation factor Ts n=1 Tax=endosymbiont of Galathealinum brachiosum TaxID=2200906 RepID=A0A370DK30_9GAMM|nr:MAG: elongation factor Ts [endosymbiont of Galathealinum brachiosum]